MEPAGALEGAARGRPVHVRGGQPRAGRTAPGVDDLGRSEDAPFAEHQPGRRVGVRRQVRAADALAEQAAPDRVAEPVGTDPADERHLMTEPREPDRDVRLGARDEAVEGGRLGTAGRASSRRTR